MLARSSNSWQGEVVGQLIAEVQVASGERLIVEPTEGTRAVVIFIPEEPPK